MTFEEFRKHNPEIPDKGTTEPGTINFRYLTDMSFRTARKMIDNRIGKPKDLRHKYSTTLIVKVTHLCNLNCPYCYDRLLREESGTSKMSLDTIRKVAEVFKNEQVMWIWHGGEPTVMGLDFYKEAIPLVKSIIPNVEISMQSNGKLLTQEWYDYFDEVGMKYPGLSFDGLTNESTRGTTKEILNIIDMCKEKKYPTGGIMVITEQNVDNLISEYEYGKSIRFNQQMNLAFDPGYDTHGHSIVNVDRFIKYLTEFFDYWMWDVNGVKNITMERYIKQVAGRTEALCEYTNCMERWFGINCNGDLYPCGRNWINFEPYCNIYDVNSPEEIKQSKRYQEWNNICLDFYNRKECKACKWFGVCMGGCPAIAHLEHSTNPPTSAECQIRVAMLDHIFKRITEVDIYDNYNKLNPFFISAINYMSIITPAFLNRITP